MLRAVSVRFIPVAVVFLILCISVLSLAAASTFVPAAAKESRETRADILSTLLR
jgi:hypothetical protein